MLGKKKEKRSEKYATVMKVAKMAIGTVISTIFK